MLDSIIYTMVCAALTGEDAMYLGDIPLGAHSLMTEVAHCLGSTTVSAKGSIPREAELGHQ